MISLFSRASLRRLLANCYLHSGLLRVVQAQTGTRILMYHRVVNPDDVPYPLQPGMYVRPETFAQQMQYLARESAVLRLEDLIDCLSRGVQPPKRSTVITFDDGWYDNFENALPVLRQFELPATIFLATSYINTNNTFWTDRLAFALYQLHTNQQYTRAAAERIREADLLPWPIREHAAYLLDLDTTSFSVILDAFLTWMKSHAFADRQNTVTLLTRLAQEFSSARLDRSFITWTEAQEMSRSRITFGSHTDSHQNLCELSPAHISSEIDQSLHVLRSHDLPTSGVFCYPGGCWSKETQQVLKEKDVRWALAENFASSEHHEPHLLGRIGIHQDVASSIPLFAARIWGNTIF